MRKKLFIITLLVFLIVSLAACTNNEVEQTQLTTSFFDFNQGIIFPEKPYNDDDHILIKDQYAFYNLAGNTPSYWKSANVHDPAIIKEGDYYYVFSTDAQFGITTYKGIHIRKSKDLVNFEWVGTALDLPSTQEQVDYIEYNRDGDRVDFFWAPDIVKRPKEGGGYEYWLFYSNSSFGQRTSCMALAKADNIEGPYVFDKEILRTHQSVGNTPNAIDPAIFTEDISGTEKMWLSYGSWSSGIYIIELDPNTGHPLIEQTLTTQVVSVNTDETGITVEKEKLIPASSDDPAFGTRLLNIRTTEAPYIIKEGDFYYLFVTNGRDLTYDYEVKVFRSDNILGPYIDQQGNLALVDNQPENYRLHGNKLTDAYQFQPLSSDDGLNRGWAAIGHNTAIKDLDKWFFVSHYRGTYMDKDRFFLGIREMFFVDGWPVLAPHRYIPGADYDLANAFLNGEYQVHILNKDSANAIVENNIISIINQSKLITLTNDSSDDGWYQVSGDIEGRWRFLPENSIEIVLNNILYKGYFIPAFSYEKEEQVLSFVALSDEGISIWGSRSSLQSGE